MVQKMLMIALLCILAGCQKTQAPVSAPIVSQQEAVAVPTSPPQESEVVPAVETPEPSQAEEIDDASLQARLAMEQSISRGITQANDSVTRNAETIIAENRWGFSVYDPATGTIEYYASNGVLLGKREKS